MLLSFKPLTTLWCSYIEWKAMIAADLTFWTVSVMGAYRNKTKSVLVRPPRHAGIFPSEDSISGTTRWHAYPNILHW